MMPSTEDADDALENFVQAPHLYAHLTAREMVSAPPQPALCFICSPLTERPFLSSNPRAAGRQSSSAAASSAAEVEDTIKRISSHKGVQGILIFNYEGVALKSTMPRELTVKYSGLFVQLIVKARSVVRSIDAENDLLFLRVRTKKHEVLVAPDKDYVLLVVQDPDSSTGSH